MYEDELRRVRRKIDRIAAANKFTEMKVYIFGVSDNSRQIIKALRIHNIQPVGVIDNDSSKQGSYCAGIKVLSFEAIRDAADKHNLYVVYSAYWREMLGQLEQSGVKKHNIVLLYKKKMTLARLIYVAFMGRRIYNRLLMKYGSVPVFICPYTGTGDIYLIGTFWKAYCEQNNIDNYIFIVISRACEKTAMLFGIKNIVVLKKTKEAAQLICAHMLWPDELPMKLLNDCWGQIHTNQIEWFRGFKGLNFEEMFRRYVFDFTDPIRPQHPKYLEVDSELSALFAQNGFSAGKTVVLSPYSNTLFDLPDEFWVHLAERLIEKGYVVCTNSSGDLEPAVAGTTAVFFPLNIAPQFLNKAGYFIGVRSGFCDIISGSSAKKIILYDSENRFYKGSAYEYFSLNAMKLCNDAVEIQFDRSNKNTIIETILNCL